MKVAKEYSSRSGETLNKKQVRNRWLYNVKLASQVQSTYKSSKKLTGGGSNLAPPPSDLESMVLDAAGSINVDFPRPYDQESAALAKRKFQNQLETK